MSAFNDFLADQRKQHQQQHSGQENIPVGYQLEVGGPCTVRSRFQHVLGEGTLYRGAMAKAMYGGIPNCEQTDGHTQLKAFPSLNFFDGR